MKKQIGGITYGKGAKEWAEQEADRLRQYVLEGFASGRSDPLGWSALGMPWDEWSVEEVDGGFAVFVERKDGAAWLASHIR